MSSGPTGPTISHARTFIITAYLYFAFFFLSLFFLLYLSRIINRGLMYFPRRKWNLRVRTIFPRNNIYVCINIRLLTLPPFPSPGGPCPARINCTLHSDSDAPPCNIRPRAIQRCIYRRHRRHHRHRHRVCTRIRTYEKTVRARAIKFPLIDCTHTTRTLLRIKYTAFSDRNSQVGSNNNRDILILFFYKLQYTPLHLYSHWRRYNIFVADRTK